MINYKDLAIIIKKNNDQKICKVCRSSKLVMLAHTATCKNCGVLLNFPYTIPREIDYLEKIHSMEEIEEAQKSCFDWHIKSKSQNHNNFTNMLLFCEKYMTRESNLDVLDYGGGGGQFSLVLKSLYPNSNSKIVDMNDLQLLNVFRPMNHQIKFNEFEKNSDKFDFIFMNDVFEHLTFPLETLKLLSEKLKPNGKIFIDTPCTFWLYPLTKFFSKKIHKKLLNGTVDFDHQQIWTKYSFYKICSNSGYKVLKFKRLSEFTQAPSFYLDNMGIKNPVLRFLGSLFVLLSPLISKNKIMSVLGKNDI
ncbi:class I SAM-dependent methyltransferase [Candidatus Pelagibacter sp.]|nr:class I SAM-dependent methyltransferase [Candidatus Pelagibacter sp.]